MFIIGEISLFIPLLAKKIMYERFLKFITYSAIR